MKQLFNESVESYTDEAEGRAPLPTESLQEFKAELFRALAHPTRIRLLEQLRTGELSVSELQQRLGLEMASVSQQPGVLHGRDVVVARREGSSVFYRLRDPAVGQLLDVARSIFNTRLAELQALNDRDPDPGAGGAQGAGPER